MSITVSCPSCGKNLQAPETAVGKKAKCPGCSETFVIEEPVHEAEEVGDDFGISDSPAPAPTGGVGDLLDQLDTGPRIGPPGLPSGPAAAASESGEDRRPCPMCGEMIQRTAMKCRFCGEIFDETLAKSSLIRGRRPAHGESVEQAAQRLIAEKHDKTTAIQLFVTSIIGCFSPILAIYGLVFVLRRPYPFPCKGLAIAGTLIHFLWTLMLVLAIAAGQM